MKSLDQIEPRTPISSLPYTIDIPGSYYLTQNLSGGSGITVGASDVTIDLAGFEISLNADYAINVQDGFNHVLVRNGSINSPLGAIVASTFDVTGMTVEDVRADVSAGNGPGISVGDKGVIRNCVVRANGSNAGISGGASSRIINCTVIGLNTADSRSGIEVGNRSVVTGCVANNNASVGIKGGDDCAVSDCTARSNLFNGILILGNGRVTNCTTIGNNGHGIATGTSATVTNCITGSNANDGVNAGIGSTATNCSARLNAGNGISVSSGTIKDCTVSSNDGDGIHAGVTGPVTIEGCTALTNQGNGINILGDGSVINTCAVSLSGKKTSPFNTAADGIKFSARTRVVNCTAFNNAQHGIEGTSGGNRGYIEGCVMQGNTGFAIAVPANTAVIIRNEVGGNTAGTINQTGGNIAPVQNASDAVGSIHPLANYP